MGEIMTLKQYLENKTIKERVNSRFGRNAHAFKSALLDIYNNNKLLQQCDPKSIVGAAALAASVNLSISPSLGQAYIVPYKRQAQFQVGFRGYIQLALRTGQYSVLHAGTVCEGELRGFNPLTGEAIIGEKTSDEIAGYVAYMKLVNGFEKTMFMSVAEAEEHARRYSQSYVSDRQSGRSLSTWSTNFDAMATKTVLKKLLRTWGILSTELSEALQGDQAVIDKNTFTYPDRGGEVFNREPAFMPEPDPIADLETGEVIETTDLVETQV